MISYKNSRIVSKSYDIHIKQQELYGKLMILLYSIRSDMISYKKAARSFIGMVHGAFVSGV